MSLGTPELIVIFVLILLLFGPNRLPELARGLGKGMREFRKVTSEFQNQLSALGEHDEEPRRARNERSQEDSDYRTAPYDSNKLDTTYNDTSNDIDGSSPEHEDRYAARSLEHDDATNPSGDSSNSAKQSIDASTLAPAPKADAPPADEVHSTTSETKPPV